VIVVSQQPDGEGPVSGLVPPPGVGPDAVLASVPGGLVEAWQEAYREYGYASEATSSAQPGDPDVARAMAATSLAVASAWREIAAQGAHSWWSLAAVEAAAQAFEFQARDWGARAAQVQGGRLRSGRRGVR